MIESPETFDLTPADEDALRNLLRGAAAGTPPADPSDLDTVIRRGRRVRIRRRTGLGAGALLAGASVAVAAVGIVQLTQPSAAEQYQRPAGFPAYQGPAFLPLTEWQRSVAALLPGEVIHSYPVGTISTGEFTSIDATFRVRHNGHTAVVRIGIWTNGGGNNGYCSKGLQHCSPLVAAPEVPGAMIQTAELDQTYAHEDGLTAFVLRGVHQAPEVGAAPDNRRAQVELEVTAVAGDVGPRPDGYTVGMVVAAEPVLTTNELLALAQELPLPTSVRSALPHSS